MDAQGGGHARGDFQRPERGVYPGEHRRLVFLKVAIVGERQALHDRQHAIRFPSRVPARPRISSSESGFFFCGIKLLPVE